MGNYLFSGSDDGNLFVIDGRPSTMFQPLGFICKFVQTVLRSILKQFGTETEQNLLQIEVAMYILPSVI